MANRSETFTFSSLPKNLAELKAFPEADLKSPFKTAALAVLVFLRYEESPDDCFEMLDFLNGPEEVTPFQKQFIRDRLVGKAYVPRSFLAGTSPSNDYTPTTPYTITVSDNPYSYQNQGYATLYIKSSGADSLRQITLRTKPSTGEWFVNQQMLLADIRVPQSADPWA